MKNLLAGILLAALLCYMVHLCLHPDPHAPAVRPPQDVQESTPPEPTPAAHKTVKVDIRFNSTTLGIKNLDQTTWPALNVFINGDPPFTYRYVIGSLKPGEAVTVALGEFAKDKSGERFDPYRFKLTKVWIGGHDFDYEAYGF